LAAENIYIWYTISKLLLVENDKKGKIMRTAITCLLMLFILASVGKADWSGATADRNISYFSGNNQSASYVRIAKGPEDNLYIVWRQGGGYPAQYELYFGRSTDNGVTWSSESADVQISANDDQDVSNVGDKAFGMATDSQGNIYIVWAEDLVDYKEIMLLKSTDQGVSWIHSDTDFPISYDGDFYTDANDPDLALDSDDNIYVVWHQNTDAATVEIHISISDDYGETWSGTTADRYISYPNGTNATNPDIAISPENHIYVVWDELEIPDDPDSPRILFGKSTDGGATFSSETADSPVGTQMRAAGDPDIAVDLSGNVHVTWQGALILDPGIIYEAFYSRSTDGGVTWSGLSEPQTVDFGPEDGSSIHNHGMAVTSAGDLIVVWQETPPGYEESEIWASYSTDGGLSWSGNTEPDRLSYPDPDVHYGGYRPDVVAGACDTLHVVWNEGVASSGYYDIHYSRGDTLDCEVQEPVPTLSEWGMIMMGLLMLVVGTIAAICKRRVAVVPTSDEGHPQSV
jgi:hypothetical protein